MRSLPLPKRDAELVQIVDASLADAARRSGHWLACRPGCTQCCLGPFPINQLDVARLQQGLRSLDTVSPKRSARLRRRVRASVARLSPDFPGDRTTGVLDQSPEGEEKFARFANDECCPVLNQDTGLCELYEARPMTCRVFGPPVRIKEGLGACELCYHGASDQQIAACELVADPNDLESDLLRQVERKSSSHGHTIVAFALVNA